MTELILAAIAFVGSHFVLANAPVRDAIAGRFGEGPFLVVYAIVAAATFAWTIVAYGAAPHVDAWIAPAWAGAIPLVVMPFAFILVVAAYTTANLTAIKQDKVAERPDPAPGIMRVTRHPMMWGVTLWAAAHAPANGDQATLILLGAIAVLALGGMVMIDIKKRRRLGDGWARFAATTSIVPFGAILAGRTTFDWPGIGLWRLGLGLVAYVFFLVVHRWLIGVPAIL